MNQPGRVDNRLDAQIGGPLQPEEIRRVRMKPGLNLAWDTVRS